MTLQDYRREHYPTMRDFATAMGCSTGKATTLLQGRHRLAIGMEEMRRLAGVLHIEVEECMAAMDKSYEQWHGREEAKAGTKQSTEPPLVTQVLHFTSVDDFARFLLGKES